MTKKTRAKFSVVGGGELVLDHVFVRSDSGVIYHGTRGGGSFSNVLANVAYSGGQASCIAVCGDDAFGAASYEDLSSLGVDLSATYSQKGKATRVVFQMLDQTKFDHSGSASHEFGVKCSVCGNCQADRQLARFSRRAWDSVGWTDDASGVCVDRLTDDRMSFVQFGRERGALTAVDIGRLGYLRWKPAIDTVHRMAQFDIVMMPHRVVQSLIRRLRVRTERDLARIVGETVIIVTRGDSGATILDGRNPAVYRSQEVAVTEPIVARDSAGAGDALLAGMLCELGQRGVRRTEFRDLGIGDLERLVRSSSDGLRALLEAIGARGHIPMSGRSEREERWPWFRYTGWPVEDIAKELHGHTCVFCNSVKPRRAKAARKKLRSLRANVSLLARRMVFAAEKVDVVNGCREIISSPRATVVVGTGGSFPVACFVADVLREKSGASALATRPFDAARGRFDCDRLIVISYSGRTSDCGAAIVQARQAGVREIVLVTGAPRPKLKQLLRLRGEAFGDRVLLYKRVSGGERGFVSFAGTLSPCAVWTAAASEAGDMAAFTSGLQVRDVQEYADASREIARIAEDGGVVHVFGGGLAWPAMIDLESKFVEGNLGVVQLHESKDFSHGRFMSVLQPSSRPRAAVVIQSSPIFIEYESKLVTALARRMYVVHIRGEATGHIGALDALLRVQYLVASVADALRRDISRPRVIPRDGLELYRSKL